MPDERRQDLDLNLTPFWNELIRSGGDPAAGDLDPDRAETLRRLHAMTRTPPPAAARVRVDRGMRAQFAVQQNGKESTFMGQTDILALLQPGSHPKGWLLPSPSWAARPRWPAVPVGTALLLLLTVSLVYLALGPGRPGADRTDSLPAVATPALPAPGELGEETLLALPLLADLVPSEGSRSFVWTLGHYTLPPYMPPVRLVGSTWDAAIGECCPGVRFEYVVEGT